MCDVVPVEFGVGGEGPCGTETLLTHVPGDVGPRGAHLVGRPVVGVHRDERRRGDEHEREDGTETLQPRKSWMALGMPDPSSDDPISRCVSVLRAIMPSPMSAGYSREGRDIERNDRDVVAKARCRQPPSVLDRDDRFRPAVQPAVAVVALVAAQFVMLLVMTMTPGHIRGHDHGLAAVGGVLSLHFAGMFALAPVAGKASDRFGGQRVALAGLVMVAAAAVLAGLAPTSSIAGLSVALLLLGLGWSAAFVASSSMLAAAGALLQGRADAVGWAFAALASVSSGILIASVGYTTMCLIGAAIATAAALRVAREFRPRPHRAPDVAPALR